MRSRLTPLDFTLYGGIVFAWGFTWIAQHYQVGVVEPEVSVVWRFRDRRAVHVCDRA